MNFDVLKKILAEASAEHGITEYEIYYAQSASTSVRALGDEISAFQSSSGGGICYRCAVDGKMGYASTQFMDEGEMRELVERALENARNTEKPDIVGIFEGSKEYAPLEPIAYTPLDAKELKEIALKIQKETLACGDYVGKATRCAASTSGSTIRLVNSHGVDLSISAGGNYVMSMPVVTKDGQSDNNGERDEYTPELDTAALAKKAVDGALDKIGAGSVPSGKYDLVISSEMMSTLLAKYSSAFSSKSAQLGYSLLAGKEGQKIASDIVTITDDPMREGMKFKINFDAEGVATKRKCVVEAGVLKTLLYNRETAKKAGVETTGNASKGGYTAAIDISPFAFCIEAGDKTLDELFGMVGNGIYITSLGGLHAGANPTTGDFSLQSEGFIIEDGKKGKPIKTFTISGNFYELLKSIEALENVVDLGVPGGFTTFGSPAALVRGVSVAGKDN